MADRIRVFVGCDPNDSDLEQMMVLEYSLRKHASRPVDIQWMRLSRDPHSPWFSDAARGLGWRTETWSTPFSAFRWSVPACCDYRGRAIYMDADMLVLCDIAEVWETPLGAGKVVAGRPYRDSWLSCVSVWDCARAQAHIPPLDTLRANPHAHRDMKRYFTQHAQLVQPLDTRYNCVDGDGLPMQDIRILHYSDMGTQFSHRYSLPRLAREGGAHWFDGAIVTHPREDLAALFSRYYDEALAAGYTLDAYRARPPFGALNKATQKRYMGNRTAPRSRLRPGSGWWDTLRTTWAEFASRRRGSSPASADRSSATHPLHGASPRR